MSRYRVIRCIGDSLMAGNSPGNTAPYSPMPQQLQTKLKSANALIAVYNDCIGGHRTDETDAVLQRVGNKGETHVLICVGTNDGAQGVSAATALANLRTIVGRVLGWGLVPIVQTIPPRKGSPQYDATLQSFMDTANAAILGFPNEPALAGSRVFDLRSTLWNPGDHDELHADYRTDDKLHINNAGAGVWADALIAASLW